MTVAEQSVDVTQLTYRDIVRTHFKTVQERMRLAAENFDLAQERKKAALEEDAHKDLEKQAQVQANLNEEREKLLQRLEELKEEAKKPDDTQIPQLVDFIIFSHDGIKLTFKCQYKGNTEDVEIETTLANIFHKCGRAQIQSMKKSKKRLYLEKGIDFLLAFHSDSIIKYLTAQEFHDIRAAFIGKKCISHLEGVASKNQITGISIKANEDNAVSITIGEGEHEIHEPIAVAANDGAIWAYDQKAGSFTWLWFSKE